MVRLAVNDKEEDSLLVNVKSKMLRERWERSTVYCGQRDPCGHAIKKVPTICIGTWFYSLVNRYTKVVFEKVTPSEDCLTLKRPSCIPEN